MKEDLKKLIDKYGDDAQLTMAMEEAAEFIQAVNKVRRNNSELNRYYLLEEIADLEIMLEQVKIITKAPDIVIESVKKEKIKKALK